MTLIMQKFEELGKDCDYWISTGDYNTAETNTAFNAIKGKMKNARSAAPADRTDHSRTYTNVRASGGGTIDHILCSESMEVVEYHTIIENFRYMPYLSDHYPVYSIIKL
jgi:endonuclease/exonuclease/phosphatase family metal-dependent hydrolase